MKKNKFPRIPTKVFKKTVTVAGVFLLVIFAVVCFEVYAPLNPASHETMTYVAKKGMGDDEIAKDLQKMGVIRSSWFFRFYVVASLQHSKLQAGKYILSPRMSIHFIAKKMATGDVVKNTLVIPEGWDIKDIGSYVESKNICTQKDFISAASKNYSSEFDFLKDKPKDVSLEGYLFPDTYQIADGDNCDDIVMAMLLDFDKKITPQIKAQITNDPKSTPKSIFDIVTMASMIEKEVRSLTDKKIVSGILWKRLSVGMPLQLDSTVNYITDRSDPSVSIRNTKINSPYNTYKYKGLPKGPISNPGIDSITAALNPTKTEYWFYLSDGRTIYSKTGEEHAANKAKYLN